MNFTLKNDKNKNKNMIFLKKIVVQNVSQTE
jgi:hypothetical protein